MIFGKDGLCRGDGRGIGILFFPLVCDLDLALGVCCVVHRVVADFETGQTERGHLQIGFGCQVLQYEATPETETEAVFVARRRVGRKLRIEGEGRFCVLCGFG